MSLKYFMSLEYFVALNWLPLCCYSEVRPGKKIQFHLYYSSDNSGNRVTDWLHLAFFVVNVSSMTFAIDTRILSKGRKRNHIVALAGITLGSSVLMVPFS